MKTIKNWFIQPLFWGKWIDIETFSFGYDGYLLQGKVNSLSNAKRFRITIMKQRFTIANAPFVELDKLKELGL